MGVGEGKAAKAVLSRFFILLARWQSELAGLRRRKLCAAASNSAKQEFDPNLLPHLGGDAGEERVSGHSGSQRHYTVLKS